MVARQLRRHAVLALAVDADAEAVLAILEASEQVGAHVHQVVGREREAEDEGLPGREVHFLECEQRLRVGGEAELVRAHEEEEHRMLRRHPASIRHAHGHVEAGGAVEPMAHGRLRHGHRRVHESRVREAGAKRPLDRTVLGGGGEEAAGRAVARLSHAVPVRHRHTLVLRVRDRQPPGRRVLAVQ